MNRFKKALKYKSFTLFLMISFAIFGLILAILFYIFTNWLISKKEAEIFRTRVKIEAKNKENFLNLYIKYLTRSLKSIAYNPYFMSYAIDRDYLKQAEFLFLTIMLEHPDYMQLRFINAQGYEVLRYDRDKIDGYPYKNNYLQDKSKRYYFLEASKLKEGDIHISKIDYNIENGQLVKPIVPVFRVSMPIYHKNEFKGVLTINTFAKEIIKIFTSSSRYESAIFDNKGYLIYAKGEFFDKNFEPKRIEDIYPVVKKYFPLQKKSYLSIKDRLYIYPIELGKNLIYLTYFLKPNSLLKLKGDDYKIAIFILSFLVILAFILSYILSQPLKKIYKLVESQKRELENLNATLEERVLQKSIENAKKDRMIIHQARLAELGEMIGNIAHQWRHPLTRLSLILQNIKAFSKKDKLNKEKLYNMIDSAKEQIFFMSDTIDNFRDFYRPSNKIEKFRIKDAYLKVLNIIGYDLKHKNISIEYKEDEKFFIFGDLNQLAQVFMNIIINAKDVLLERRIKNGKITIYVKREGDNILIDICDNGGGVREENLLKIFEPYFSTKKQQGTGIGLYMVKTILETKFNGKVDVYNKKDGACFKILIKEKR